jgi:uncharacterized integral membrane protein
MVKKDIFQLSIKQLNGKTKGILLLITVFVTIISIAGIVRNIENLYQEPGKVFGGLLALYGIAFLAILSISIAINSKECKASYFFFSTVPVILLILETALAVFLLVKYPALIFFVMLSLTFIAFVKLTDC